MLKCWNSLANHEYFFYSGLQTNEHRCKKTWLWGFAKTKAQTLFAYGNMIYLILQKWIWQVIALIYVPIYKSFFHIIIHSGWSIACIFMKERVKDLFSGVWALYLLTAAIVSLFLNLENLCVYCNVFMNTSDNSCSSSAFSFCVFLKNSKQIEINTFGLKVLTFSYP